MKKSLSENSIYYTVFLEGSKFMPYSRKLELILVHFIHKNREPEAVPPKVSIKKCKKERENTELTSILLFILLAKRFPKSLPS